MVQLPMKPMSMVVAVEEEKPKALKLVSTAATLLQVKFVLDMFLKEMIQTTGQV